MKNLFKIASRNTIKEQGNVKWIRYNLDQWYVLEDLNLTNDYFEEIFGVYIIWRFTWTGKSETIRVGKGMIKYKLFELKNNSRIMKYGKPANPLYVTWAEAEQDAAEGIEKYLGLTLNPVVNVPYSKDIEMIKVNLPDIF
ncbi:MAG: hypothetical protein JXR56_07390 [Candidatus Cloacimonetes bacterium]|nr:hypothetical protein [Candidatus Cloacimonadota bacterium]